LFSATSTDQPLTLGGFVPLPVVTFPKTNAAWDLSQLALAPVQGGNSVQLTVVRIDGGSGLYEWTLVAPGASQQLPLPNLAKLAPEAALPVGNLSIQTTLAHIEDVNGFDYGKLRYRQLAPRGWNAHATDTIYTHH